VVAASAISGYIDGPDDFESSEIVGNIKVNKKESVVEGSTRIIEGFPETIEGEIVFCHQDNLNTDGIFPGKYTYIDDFKPEQQAGVVMENYDPEFGKIAKEGDILVGGYNFGTGSSREQAATALKYKGIRLVVAGSFSETYKRNALNNGFLAIEAPELVDNLKKRYGTGKLTVKDNLRATVDFRRSVIVVDGKSYAIGPVGTAAQELIVMGGLENWVKQNM
jgi:homoaconitate hydratase